MPKPAWPVRWVGQLAVVVLPEHIDASNARQVSEQLLDALEDGVALADGEGVLTSLPTADGHFTIAMIRDVTKARRLEDLAGSARAAAPAGPGHHTQELLDWITSSLFQAGLSLEAVAGGHDGAASQAIADTLGHLDEVIRVIRDATFASLQRSSDDG